MNIPFLNRISVRDRAFLARQLSTMLSSGIPLAQSLKILISETKNPAIAEAMNAVIKDVESGLPFSASIEKQPKLFGKIYTAMTRSGEASGKLEDVLTQLADNIENENVLTSKIRGAMIYPLFIIVAMIGVTILMMVQVMPQLKSIFLESNVALPFTTRALIAISDFTVNYWWILVVAVVGLFAGAQAYYRTETGQMTLNNIEARIPGGLSENLYMARFTRTMSMLVKAGIPIIEALTIAGDVMNNRVYQNILVTARGQVERGIPLSVPLGENAFFPKIVSQMILVGEQTGKLDEILDKLANYYEEEMDNRIRSLSSLLEPVIIVILGVAVAFLIIAILMPIYNIAQLQ